MLQRAPSAAAACDPSAEMERSLDEEGLPVNVEHCAGMPGAWDVGAVFLSQAAKVACECAPLYRVQTAVPLNHCLYCSEGTRLLKAKSCFIGNGNTKDRTCGRIKDQGVRGKQQSHDQRCILSSSSAMNLL
jgi:hypothetical protein